MIGDISRFGANIKKRRKELNLTQLELAKKVWPDACDYQNADARTLEQKRKNIVNYESGKFPKDVDIYLSLCAALDCDIAYLFGYIEQHKQAQADIQAETGLSALAVDNLCIASSGPESGPIDSSIVDAPHDDLRNYEIGRIAKIRFLQVLLENDDLWERISVCAYDYRQQMTLYEADPYHDVNGILHNQFANVAKEDAKEVLSMLFKKIPHDAFDWE